jgi:hypothetical protein
MTEDIKTKRWNRRIKYSPEPLAEMPDEASLGPAMKALSLRNRRFVLELASGFGGPGEYGASIRAARAAGFGTPTSSQDSLKDMACNALHRPDVQAALKEVGGKIIRASSFMALRNIEKIANDPTHKDTLKANLALVDRGFPLQREHHVVVEHIDYTKQALQELAVFRRLGVGRDKLESIYGRDGLWRLEQQLDAVSEPKLIEGTVNG